MQEVTTELIKLGGNANAPAATIAQTTPPQHIDHI